MTNVSYSIFFAVIVLVLCAFQLKANPSNQEVSMEPVATILGK